MAVSARLVELHNLVTEFLPARQLLAKPRPTVRAVDDVSLNIRQDEVLGLVGESGCGKSTLAKTILGLYRETSGDILLNGKEVSGVEPEMARRIRRDIQYVHQDPGAALDPWWRIGGILHETLIIHGQRDNAERERQIDAMLEAVGLDPSFKRRYRHELSGGQQRRVGLARTLILKPRLVILDEPTSGLDLSVQATVLRLMRDIKTEFGLTYLFISHDLSVVRRVCDRVAIMYLGRIVEIGDTGRIFETPRHPYTQALLAAAPSLVPGQLARLAPLEGDPPSVISVPSGCAFRTRCDYAVPACAQERPPLEGAQGEHRVACFRWREIMQTEAQGARA